MFSKQQMLNEHQVKTKKERNHNFFYKSKPKYKKTRTVEQLKTIIMSKIEQKCSKPTDQIRQVRRLFAQTKPNEDEGSSEDGSSGSICSSTRKDAVEASASTKKIIKNGVLMDVKKKQLKKFVQKNGGGGLGPNEMATAFHSLGIVLNDKEITLLFNYIDRDQSGDCSMQEMLAGCLPQHFTATPWWEKSRERQTILGKTKQQCG